MSDLSVIKDGKYIVISWKSVGGASACDDATHEYNVKVTGAISEEVNENVTETSLSKAVGVSGKITVTITSNYIAAGNKLELPSL